VSVLGCRFGLCLSSATPAPTASDGAWCCALWSRAAARFGSALGGGGLWGFTQHSAKGVGHPAFHLFFDDTRHVLGTSGLGQALCQLLLIHKGHARAQFALVVSLLSGPLPSCPRCNDTVPIDQRAPTTRKTKRQKARSLSDAARCGGTCKPSLSPSTSQLDYFDRASSFFHHQPRLHHQYPQRLTPNSECFCTSLGKGGVVSPSLRQTRWHRN